MRHCPVCGTVLHENDDVIIQTTHHNRQYRICSDDHEAEFERAPGNYT